MKKTMLAMCVAGGLMLSSVSLAAGAKIGVVNIQKIFVSSPKVAATKKKLMGEFNTKKSALQAKQKSIQAKVDDYKKNSSVMSKAQKQKAQTQLAALQNSLMQMEQGYEQQMDLAQQKAMQKFVVDLKGVVATVAKSDKLDLVVPSNAAIYSSPSMDITAKVAKQFNAK
jgi:outer membrane protein